MRSAYTLEEALGAVSPELAAAVRDAAARGHVPEWDPSFQGYPRFTCWECERAVVQPGVPVYGSLIDHACKVNSEVADRD